MTDIEIPQKLSDKDYRIGNLYHIINKQKQLVTFQRNPAQAKFAKERALRNIILKSRQLGFTTDACIDMLDEAIFTRNFNGVIIAHDLESLDRIFNKVEVAWDNFDKELKGFLGITTIKRNTSEMEFNNGSRISVSLSSRSDTVNWLHVSEFGKICAKYPHKAQEIITGAIPSVPQDGRITIESTAEGEDGQFYEMFWDAWDRGCEPRNSEEYKSFFFSWVQDKGLVAEPNIQLPLDIVEYKQRHLLTDPQATWYFMRSRTLKHLMKQEYPTTPLEAFVSSGRKVIDADIIERRMAANKDRIARGVFSPMVVGDWTYYMPYKRGHRYGMGCDVAEGVGLDSSTCVIIDFSMETPTVVARYRSKFITPEAFPYEIVAGARAYGNCLVAVERNNHGHTVLTLLKDMYNNIYSEVRKDKLTDKDTEKLGWLSTRSSKPRIVFNLKAAIENIEDDNEEAGTIDILDDVILREARKFDHTDLAVVKLDENTTRHFDTFIATAIAYEMRDYVGTSGTVRMVEETLTNPHRVMQ